MMKFKILTIEEIEAEMLKWENDLQNFPKAVAFSFPEYYQNLVTSIKTTEVSSETILYNAVEAVNENKEFELNDYWCFAGNGQGDRWFLDTQDEVFFYDHDYDEKIEPMYISFQQWLQMAFIIQQLDMYFEEHEHIPKSVKLGFYQALNTIHPKLGEHYLFSV
ncbi:SMI1/KNR4 family protein [Chryseobacterium sp. WG14]|uniref:SMI1/KNR4 family protein n=1 Tax=Chryseobacterium sp. WG14 TaxID=2926909 RepID=UPI00211F4132|nr:SMI1/KNR4 family protein [Chryseobacterium sp. WG14]MCQ9640948.1 SMI1/KNR4 family protein [Chryseobacterium sp. WG14]